jgi:hypothetical protein
MILMTSLNRSYQNIGLLLTLLLIMVFEGRPQYQSIFGASETSWNQLKGNLGGSGTDSLAVGFDTTINGKLYKNVKYYDITAYPAQPLTTMEGFIREDILTGRVWYFTSMDTAEALIMDLSLTVGDSFFVGGVWNSNVGYHFVDSVWINAGKKYIRVDVEINPNTGGNNSEKLTFIEGIGTNIGIGYQDMYYIHNFPYLLCSFKDGGTVYQNTHPAFLGICRYSTVGLPNTVASSEGIMIYPIPTDNYFQLSFSNHNLQVDRLELLSINGKNVRSFEKNETTLNIEGISPGIYFLSVSTNKGIRIEKVVIR